LAISALPARVFTDAVKAAGPSLLFGLRLWASVCLALYVAFWLELDNPYWAGTTAAIVCQPQLGASLRSGWYRIIGTVVGGLAIVLLTACFPQARIAFLVSLALWGAACAFVATLMRSFLAFSAALAGITAAIIASDELGATGGPNGQVFMLAVSRASEICTGVVCAGIILAGTDFGTAPRRLAALFAPLSVETAAGFARMLALAGPDLPETQPVRRALTRRVIELDPVIDEAVRESAELRPRETILQAAMGGLFAALAGWRTVAVHLKGLPHDQAREEAAAVLQTLPQELRTGPVEGEPSPLTADPARVRQACEAAVRALITLSTETPSRRLLADHTAAVLAGISLGLNALALLVGHGAQPVPRRGIRHQVPDWLPAVVNAVRAFVTISAVTLLWILTAWPTGASAITFATISVLLFAPRADQAYAGAIGFVFGAGLTVVCAAIVKFAVLPAVATFVGFSLALSLVLVPAGALLAHFPRQTAMFTAVSAYFCVLLAPTNPMSYDTLQLYNTALAVVAGLGVAALAFRSLPPVPPAWRARRLLALTLRDLRRLSTNRIPRRPEDWQNRVYSRLSVLPDAAEPLQRAQLVGALSVGTEIIQLRELARLLDLDGDLDAALAAVAQGNSAAATLRLAQVDQALGSRAGVQTQLVLRARSRILALSETLTQFASYFDGEAQTWDFSLTRQAPSFSGKP
jgi:uncharacterized membrane protein YccC